MLFVTPEFRTRGLRELESMKPTKDVYICAREVV